MNLGQIPPSILRSLKNQPLKWATALAELIDNSLDAQATQVRIRFEPKTVTVVDDGVGCDDIERMLTLGEHMRISSAGLGMYGVGLKEAACWLWGETRIKTRKGNVLREAFVRWDSLASSQSWDVPDPILTNAVGDEFRGTTLIFRKIDRGLPPDYEKLGRELDWIFSPALASGRQLKLLFSRSKEVLCSAWMPPPREQVIQEQFDVNGKAVRLDAGIVVMGHQNLRPGFSFSYQHRNICNSALGSKGHSIARICGVVKLDSNWRLSKNKTEIVADEEALEDAIWERCNGIILAAAEQAHILDNAELETAINDRLQEILESGEEKAKREKGETTESVEPKDTDKKHRRARQRQPGLGNLWHAGRRGGNFKICWQQFPDNTIGRVDAPGGMINLNSHHPFLSSLRDDGNVNGIVGLALALLGYSAMTTDMQKRMPLFAKLPAEYPEFLGSLLAAQKVEKKEAVRKDALA